MTVQSPSSKYKGVSWNTTCKKWLVHVRGQHVGVFESEKEAAYAYNIRAKQDFGAFVKLNEIQFDKNGRFNFDYYCKNWIYFITILLLFEATIWDCKPIVKAQI